MLKLSPGAIETLMREQAKLFADNPERAAVVEGAIEEVHAIFARRKLTVPEGLFVLRSMAREGFDLIDKIANACIAMDKSLVEH